MGMKYRWDNADMHTGVAGYLGHSRLSSAKDLLFAFEWLCLYLNDHF